MPRFQVPSVCSSERSPRSARTRNTGRRPGRPLELDPRSLREDAREVGGDAAAGHVAEGVDAVAGLGDEVEERRGVQAGRLEEGLAQVVPKSAAFAPYWMPFPATM